MLVVADTMYAFTYVQEKTEIQLDYYVPNLVLHH